MSFAPCVKLKRNEKSESEIVNRRKKFAMVA